MSETTHTMNKPGWANLSSNDAATSREFYAGLFGWTADVTSDPSAGGYGTFKCDGKEVAGISPRHEDQQPTAWTMHVLVESADETARRAREAGGTVILEPTEIRGEGRVTILADPSGAAFGAWQPERHEGWQQAATPGSFAWFELQSCDLEPAKDFYSKVFDWRPTRRGIPTPGYTTFGFEDSNAFAGGMQRPKVVPQQLPSFWQPYIAVADVDAVCEQATKLGARMLAPPQEAVNIGRWAVFQDPMGAMFGVMQPGVRGPAP